MTDLTLKEKLNALCKEWKQAGYKHVNPDVVTEQLREAFKGATQPEIEAAMAATLFSLKESGMPRLTQRVRIGYQNL